VAVVVEPGGSTSCTPINRCNVNGPPRQPHPIAAATQWVAKITTVALEMILPAVAGGYFDRRWGTNYWVLVGLVLGGTVGFWHLLKMTRPKRSTRLPGDNKDSTSGTAGR
jgi:hypothetical protein